MGPRLWAGILIGFLFSNLPLAQAQDPSELKKIEISGGFFKVYKVDDVRIKKLKELGSILGQMDDIEVDESFTRGKGWNSYAQVFAFSGGALVGYSLGQALAGKALNQPVLYTGIGITSVGLGFATIAEKHILTAVERYNTVWDERYQIGLRADPFNRSAFLTLAW